MKIERISPVLTIIENNDGDCYSVVYESGYPIQDNDIAEIIDDDWSFWDVKATYTLIPEPSSQN